MATKAGPASLVKVDIEECCPPRQKSTVERLKAKVEPLSSEVIVDSDDRTDWFPPFHPENALSTPVSFPFTPDTANSTSITYPSDPDNRTNWCRTMQRSCRFLSLCLPSMSLSVSPIALCLSVSPIALSISLSPIAVSRCHAALPSLSLSVSVFSAPFGLTSLHVLGLAYARHARVMTIIVASRSKILFVQYTSALPASPPTLSRSVLL